jgi:hypothetical protein
VKFPNLIKVVEMAKGLDSIFDLALGLLIGGAMVGAAVTAVFAQNTSTWDTGTVAMWGVVGILGAGLFIYALYKSIK